MLRYPREGDALDGRGAVPMSADGLLRRRGRWLGTPYRHQAATLGAGCDCLGLVRGVWRDALWRRAVDGAALSRRTGATADAGELQAAAERLLVPGAGPLAAGQVVLFRLSGRRGRGIAASWSRRTASSMRRSGSGVVEANLTEGWAASAGFDAGVLRLSRD